MLLFKICIILYNALVSRKDISVLLTRIITLTNIINKDIIFKNFYNLAPKYFIRWIFFNFSLFYDYYINISLIILSAGFMFKISATPFHFWSPDVYDSVPTTVTIFIAIIAKIFIFIFFFRFGTLSLIIGSILGLIQFIIKITNLNLFIL